MGQAQELTERRPAAPPVRVVPVMAALLCALVPVQLDALVTATALPTIAGDLGGFGRLAWIATLYLLTMAVGTAVGGRFGDQYGRRAVLLAAQAVFVAGSLWAALAGGMTGLLLARAVQGLGAGITLTSLMATVADIAPPEKRARYQSMFGAVAPLSMIIGPWIGGIITDHLGWRWIFALNIPVVALAMVGVALLLRTPRERTGGRIDSLGLAAITVTGTGWVLAGSWVGRYGWTSPHVLIAGGIGAVGIAATWAVEHRAAQPFLPRALFRDRSVLMSAAVLALSMGAVMMAAINFLPVFLQLVQGRSAANSGLLLLPMLLPAIVVSLLVGRWTDAPSRFRPAMLTGTGILTAGCALIATMGPGTAMWQTMLYMIVLGAGIGMLFQTPVVLVQNAAPPREVGAATGAVSFLRMLVGAVGVGTLGSIFTGRLADGIVDSGAPGTEMLDPSSVDPATLGTLPDAAVHAVADAAASANTLLFVIATGIAAVALAAAAAVPRRRSECDTA
ncbi:MFS transporter [Tomitella gaofuii]|uniref:MFS transporter n=1 Tax=Tomitella gaofuii TaxID=2760083 RepID=UPI0015F7D4E7|nr:MFS transporter [Tomitella gaofuii]